MPVFRVPKVVTPTTFRVPLTSRVESNIAAPFTSNLPPRLESPDTFNVFCTVILPGTIIPPACNFIAISARFCIAFTSAL